MSQNTDSTRYRGSTMNHSYIMGKYKEQHDALTVDHGRVSMGYAMNFNKSQFKFNISTEFRIVF